MNMWNKSVLLVAAMMAGSVSFAQTIIGYTNGTLNKNDIVRFGNTEKQGMAIYIDAEKAAMLKGATVESFLTYVSTTQITSGTFFITKTLGGTSLYEQAFKPTSSREKMYEYSLTTPYVLDGEPFYVGHVVEASTSYKPLSFDLTSNFETGVSWAYREGEWMDISQQDLGAPNIQFKVSGVNSFTDLMVKPIVPVGYQVAGKAQVFNGQVFNFGTETITSFDLTCKVGNTAPVTSQVTGISLASGKTYDFTLPEYYTQESGTLELEVTVTNINGADDVEMSDNTAKSSVFFYPAGIEKKVLVEVFTGQSCGNCPTGHANLANAMKGIENEFIEVAHHSGYYPDQFTLEEDYVYTWLYGTSGTYAPAVTFNRSLVNDISTSSVVFASTDGASTRAAVQAFRNTQPYVDIKMYNEFDETTRTGKLFVDVHTFVEPSSSMPTLNVWLVQDGIIGQQAGGSTQYVHNHVFRGSLNNSAWGQQIALNAGESRRYTFNYTLPEAIACNYGSYVGTEFEAIPADMQLVAFVSNFSEADPTACNVYNAAKVAILADNMADGVEENVTDVQAQPVVRLEGNQLILPASLAKAEVYTSTGSLVHSVTAGVERVTLSSGFYVVRVQTLDGTVSTAKVMVR